MAKHVNPKIVILLWQHAWATQPPKKYLRLYIYLKKYCARFSCAVFLCALFYAPAHAQYGGYGDMAAMMRDGESIRSFDLKDLYAGPVYALAFGRDDKTFFSSGVDSRIHVWDFFAAKERAKMEGHRATVTSIVFTKSGRLISSGTDGLIKLWDLVKYKEMKTFTESERIEQVVSFQSTAATITGSGLNEGLSREELKNIKEKEWIEQGKGGKRSNAFSESMNNKREVFRPYINSLSLSFDDRYLLSGDNRGIVSLWNVQKTIVQKTFYGHKKKVNVVVFKPKTLLFASASDDGSIILWDWQGGDSHKSKAIKNAHEGAKVTALAYSPDGKRLASGGADNVIIIREFRAKDTVPFTLEGHEGTITKLLFTKNGRYLVSASEDNTIRVWDTQRMQAVIVYGPRQYPVLTIALSPTENFILSAGRTGIASIRLWKLNAPIKEYEKMYD